MRDPYAVFIEEKIPKTQSKFIIQLNNKLNVKHTESDQHD